MRALKSERLFRQANKKIPGGVNSPVRAWKAVRGTPKFIQQGRGATITDVDGNKYLDFVGSWGPLVLGHSHPKVVRTLKEVAARGTTFGAPTAREVDLAARICELMPAVQKVRLVSSGTEAVMSALRLARAFTKRTKIIKFDGCYHGHSDGLLVKAGSGIATLGLPDSPGVPATFARETLVARFNDIQSVTKLFVRHPDDIAAIIVEPVCGNMGVILPEPSFLPSLQKLARRFGALLIFDEVITGFRVGLGGAQQVFGIVPDLTCMGKILGGGLPLAAFGGRREIMDLLAPAGPVYQAGTLSGNPLAVAAGIETLKLLARRGVYTRLEERGKRLQEGLARVAGRYRLRTAINRIGSMITLFFGVQEVKNANDARRSDCAQFARYFHGMLTRGIYLPPAQFEAAFISLAHTPADMDRTVKAFDQWALEETSG